MQEQLENKSKQEIIDIIKTNASEEVAKILIARYGLEDGKPKSLLELHEMFPQYTREMIRQLEAKFSNDLRNKNKGEVK